MDLTLRSLAGETAELSRRYGVWLALELAAAALAADALATLAGPAFVRLVAGDSADGFFTAPSVIYVGLSSATVTAWSGLAFLRIWTARESADPGGAAALSALKPVLLPLILIQFAIDLAGLALIWLFMPLIAVLAAATCAVVPAILIERRGLSALGRNLRLVAPHFPSLLVVWAAWLVPAIVAAVVLSVLFGSLVGTVEQGGPVLLRSALTGLPFAAVNAISLLLTLVIYDRLTGAEQGGRHHDLHDVFR